MSLWFLFSPNTRPLWFLVSLIRGSEAVRIPVVVRKVSGLSATPTSVDFGQVSIGGESTRRVLLVNNSGKDLRDLHTACPDDGFRCSQVDAGAGDKLFLAVIFLPKEARDYQGSISVETANKGSALQIPVRGRGGK